MRQAKFSIGQCIHHRLFAYRGVIVDVDAVFQGTDAWYEQVARTRPPKNEPWYRVLVHDAGHETCVAERNLEADREPAPIRHPLVDRFFAGFSDGAYRSARRSN